MTSFWDQFNDDESRAFFGLHGFSVYHTGGGCTAFQKELRTPKDGYLLITLTEGCGHPEDSDKEATLWVGYHDEDGEDDAMAEVVGWQAAVDAAERIAIKWFAKYGMVDAIAEQKTVVAAKAMDDMDEACRQCQEAFGIEDGGGAAQCLGYLDPYCRGGVSDNWFELSHEARAQHLARWLHFEFQLLN